MSFSKRFILGIALFLFTLPCFAAKQIIVVQQSANGAQQCYTVANWYAITTGLQAQTKGSAWSGASAAENTAIQNGSVLEEVNTTCFPVGQDVGSIKLVLQKYWSVRNGEIGGIGPAQFQGVFFDSVSGWSQ
jgi:hypothetical protein